MLESSAHSNQNSGGPSHIQNSTGTGSEENHPGTGFHSIPHQQEYFMSHKDMYLRKGKWTAEEERYANKVIEYFNGGILKLDDHERGITLRAYLAQKLGCDPMRITKKYTGASCLGKRVYHAYKQGGKTEEVDKATTDLNMLEEEFRSRLQQINKRRGGGSYSEGQVMVSSPAIDSMFKQSGFAAGWNAPPGIMYGYHPMAGYVPNGSAGHSAVEFHIQQQLQHQHQLQHGFQSGGQSSAEGSPFRAPLEQFPRSARSYSSDQTTAPDYSPTLTGMRYNSDASYRHDWSYRTHMGRTEDTASGVDARTAFSEHFDRKDAHRAGSEGSTSSGGSSTAHHRKKHLRNGESAAGARVLHAADRTTASTGVPLKPDGLQRVKVSEHDTEAASSLLGFFTQLERNSSQEDMLHFFEGVQKNAAAATLSPLAAASQGNDAISAQASFPPLPPVSVHNK